MSLSETFVRRPVLTTLLTVSAVLFGIMAYLDLPVSDLPAVDYPVLQVQANYPGASPATMANNIATPLERQFMQISGLKLVTSQSRQGNTSLTLQFDLSKDIDAAATDVQAAITQATGSLPADLPSPPTFSKTNPNDQPIMFIALTSESLSAGKLYEYGYTQIAQRISSLPGVSRVAVFGTKGAIRIKADPFALAARGMTMDDLASGITRGTSYQGAGQLDGDFRSFLIQPRGQLESAEQYNNLIIANKNGAPIYLRDVALAKDTVVDERLSMRFKAKGRKPPAATIVLAVYRQAGANAVQVSQSIRDLVPIVSSTLPASVRLTPVYDRSVGIVKSVADVQETLIIAFVLVVIVIFLFLGRATDTLIPVVALPLSLLLTFIVMKMLGYSLDNLSLMALTLAIGFLVDDAIVFLENTVRRMEKGESALEATLASAKEISFTILSMTLSLAAVFIPLVFMPGLVGRIFREFSVTIIVSIIASGVVSLTLTPLMCARMLAGRGHDAKKTWMERVAAAVLNPVITFYSRSLHWFFRYRFLSVIIWAACMAGTVYFFMLVPKSFLPIGDSSFISGVMIAQEGSSPALMRAHQDKAEAIIDNHPAVRMTFTMAGNSNFFVPNQMLLLAFLHDPRERAPIPMVAGELMGGLSSINGTFAFMRPNPVLEINTGGASRFQGQFAYSLSGINPDEVYATANKLMNAFRGYEGMASVSSDLFMNTPQLDVEILRDQASSYGISVERIEALLRQSFSQNYLFLIKKPDDQYQLILEMDDTARSRPENLDLLYVKSDDGQRSVPLKAVARWTEKLGPQSINHINQFTSVTIFFNLKPDVTIGQALGFVNKAAADIVPPSLRAELLGEAQEFQTTVGQLIILMILAVFVMYVILGILYESYIHPLTVLSSLPVALVGGLGTLLVFGAEASLYAFIGMFMLMGIVKKNGIMIIDFALQRQAQGLESEKAIHEACLDRFRPIMMTTAAALMGAVPIALGLGADGASRRPLGLIIVGGLIVSQLITLYITPVIYLYMEAFQRKVLDRVSFFRSHRGGFGGPGGEHRGPVLVQPTQHSAVELAPK
ncbi:MAG TPA: efflux RND transporter permease subunit [Planctomycetota bacterium]|nr:efflux RND transporter permease subunit [Planctomycetota bacterium]